jgi:hypothetical protein
MYDFVLSTTPTFFIPLQCYLVSNDISTEFYRYLEQNIKQKMANRKKYSLNSILYFTYPHQDTASTHKIRTTH